MKSILLCVDGSSYSVVAAKYAIDAANLMDANVNILYASDLKRFEISMIADFGGSIGAQPYQDMLSTVINFEKKKAAFLEKKFSKLFSAAGLDDRYKFHHKTGIIFDTFDEFKNDITGLDLVIVGKRGESSDEKEEHIGETVDGILNNISCPCLVAPRQYSKIKNILVAYDGSESSTKAIHSIERNAFFKNFEIHVISINPDTKIQQNIENIEEILSKDAGLKIKTIQKNPCDAPEIISKYVIENDIDLVMTGSFSHNMIRRFLLGSTTIDILEKTPTAMLIFN